MAEEKTANEKEFRIEKTHVSVCTQFFFCKEK